MRTWYKHGDCFIGVAMMLFTAVGLGVTARWLVRTVRR